mmetsp:Transcript_9899/g.24500  ORF Transcript_9899/g.24500 Transcript_9899/m.24500 type:complete len:291 (+) Transcript_9899:240-1112(+)|eukprot:CAMPEP_0179000018 /NCGR_PEP_ID=MMETSP0795-20121207/10420_1 /TAXON_ID=88552 /ORGANISM="Amoebophrya sp., Strain Ameob2" /LENGTH=290 /DNA_ID=CAMNT_0020692931 /DNA_START=322 /DNA_END=1194 /DNA_ORIENTATION=-
MMALEQLLVESFKKTLGRPEQKEFIRGIAGQIEDLALQLKDGARDVIASYCEKNAQLEKQLAELREENAGLKTKVTELQNRLHAAKLDRLLDGRQEDQYLARLDQLKAQLQAATDGMEKMKQAAADDVEKVKKEMADKKKSVAKLAGKYKGEDLQHSTMDEYYSAEEDHEEDNTATTVNRNTDVDDLANDSMGRKINIINDWYGRRSFFLDHSKGGTYSRGQKIAEAVKGSGTEKIGPLDVTRWILKVDEYAREQTRTEAHAKRIAEVREFLIKKYQIIEWSNSVTLREH